MLTPIEATIQEATTLELSVVVPVYQGERTLPMLLAELTPLCAGAVSPGGCPFRIAEVILVHDGAIDGSAKVMQELAQAHPPIRNLWLARNYGQHPATLAGMASSTGDWIVTMDEDAQHDPAAIAGMLDVALEQNCQLVYGRGRNLPPHAFWRNLSSRLAHGIASLLLGNQDLRGFSSFRLIHGEVARSLAAYCGPGVYLDIALTWVVGRTGHCPVVLRQECGRPSGYSFSRLLSHLWRMVLTVGTRPLRIIALLGSLSILSALGISAWVLYAKIAHRVPIQGWTSLIIAVSLFSGMILFSLGVIAEYLALALTMAMGKPLYLLVSRPPEAHRPSR